MPCRRTPAEHRHGVPAPQSALPLVVSHEWVVRGPCVWWRQMVEPTMDIRISCPARRADRRLWQVVSPAAGVLMVH
jgi:hypothetical protein